MRLFKGCGALCAVVLLSPVLFGQGPGPSPAPIDNDAPAAVVHGVTHGVWSDAEGFHVYARIDYTTYDGVTVDVAWSWNRYGMIHKVEADNTDGGRETLYVVFDFPPNLPSIGPHDAIFLTIQNVSNGAYVAFAGQSGGVGVPFTD